MPSLPASRSRNAITVAPVSTMKSSRRPSTAPSTWKWPRASARKVAVRQAPPCGWGAGAACLTGWVSDEALPTGLITRGMMPAINMAAMAKAMICFILGRPRLICRPLKHGEGNRCANADAGFQRVVNEGLRGRFKLRGTVQTERLFRPVHPVAGVTQARHDIAVIVELFVDRGGPHVHLRMMAVEFLDALRCREQAYDADVPGARLLQPIHRRDRRVGGRQHRIEHQHEPIGHVLRRLEVVLDRH